MTVTLGKRSCRSRYFSMQNQSFYANLLPGQEATEPNPPDDQQTNMIVNQPTTFPRRTYLWWIRVAIYVLFLLAGQSVATLLGRLYFDKGGNGKWMSTLVQTVGFPVIILLYLLPSKILNTSTISTANSNNISSPPSSLILILSAYVLLGLILGMNSMLYTFGLLYLPVSTYSLICASQLGFNALFSFFLNAQKLTPCIINSLVLLTISSTLLVFQNDSTESTKISRGEYAIGFICTLGASAGYGLLLSLTQFAFNKVLKQETFRVVLDMIVYPSIVATCAILVGFFASGEWKGVGKEMDDFELGKVSYLMTLIWIAIGWQVFNIGCTALIFEVSSLFSNVISTVCLPLVPILAVFVFRDNMNGIKAIAMILAIWGFVSYVYQHYLDDAKSKAQNGAVDETREEVYKVSLFKSN